MLLWLDPSLILHFTSIPDDFTVVRRHWISFDFPQIVTGRSAKTLLRYFTECNGHLQRWGKVFLVIKIFRNKCYHIVKTSWLEKQKSGHTGLLFTISNADMSVTEQVKLCEATVIRVKGPCRKTNTHTHTLKEAHWRSRWHLHLFPTNQLLSARCNRSQDWDCPWRARAGGVFVL